MATARREASEPKGYFVRRLWAGSCLTWRAYIHRALQSRPQLSIRGAATDPTAILKTSLVSHR